MAMKLCAANKHYYDQAIHSDCPYCGEGGGAAKPAPAVQAAAAAPKTQILGAEAADNGVKTQLVLPDVDVIRTAAPALEPEAETDVDAAAETAAAAPCGGGPAFPVTGWLVVAAGPGQGQDFRLIQGENRIGVGEGLEVCLDFGEHRDTALDEAVQAVVVYDHHANEFFIERGDSRQLPMLNGSTIRGEPTLNAGDRIRVGQTELLFWPLCGADFRWPQA
ncbi:hypothetical protein L1281_001611 [Neisseria sp. HSC-16F19]|nr:FHA domain-containing protein [Neisseria sp. HSC-16F19]MCP2041021.1 hypothetical protein [Neisseria sp. HSC-16F19]